MSFPARWRAKRRAKGISLRALGKRLGLSAAYLSDLECGRRRWSAKSVRRNDESNNNTNGDFEPWQPPLNC